MLDIQNISKTFNPGTVNEKTALNGLTLHLNEGDFVTVIGGNGAGKSTMLNAVAGVWPVDAGRITIDGADVTRLSEYQRAKYIGRVFQDPMTGTAATMQIEENLALAARRGKPRTLRIGITRKEREEYRELLKTLDLGLEDRLTARVGLLSGGQRQALTLLMATMNRPKLLLLDEHTAALDPKTALKVLTLSARLVAENHLTTLMITHNSHQIRQPPDHDARGPHHLRRERRGKAEAPRLRPFGQIPDRQRRRVCQRPHDPLLKSCSDCHNTTENARRSFAERRAFSRVFTGPGGHRASLRATQMQTQAPSTETTKSPTKPVARRPISPSRKLPTMPPSMPSTMLCNVEAG